MTDITIYHNPNCGTSRNVLALIRNTGVEPTIVQYLKTPLGKRQLQALLRELGLPAREILRQKGTPYDELGLGDEKWTDDELIDFMVQHPILMNRPIVVTPLGAKLCRPSEYDQTPFVLEGSVLDAGSDHALAVTDSSRSSPLRLPLLGQGATRTGFCWLGVPGSDGLSGANTEIDVGSDAIWCRN